MEKKISIKKALMMATTMKDCLPHDGKLKLAVYTKDDYEKKFRISSPDAVVANYGNLDDELYIIANFKFTDDEYKNCEVMKCLVKFVNQYSNGI
ncbi:MAG: hypothetical protein ACI4E1_10160 [Lachnospira sp.]